MTKVGQFNFDWIEPNQLDNLLGNARPKTLADIENDQYWSAIFGQWVQSQGNDVQGAYNEWLADPNGDARDRLKSSGPNQDIRGDFYNDLGTLKAAHRLDNQESGRDLNNLNEALDQILPQ